MDASRSSQFLSALLIAGLEVRGGMTVRPAGAYPFIHGRLHKLPTGLHLADSYHCSRYNTNTGRLTADMFRAVFAEVRRHLDGAANVTQRSPDGA